MLGRVALSARDDARAESALAESRALHRSTGDVKWLKAAASTGKFVAETFIVRRRRVVRLAVKLLGDGALRGVEPHPPPQDVDRPEAASRDEPGPGIGGNPFLWPALERSREGVMERILCQVKIPQQSD